MIENTTKERTIVLHKNEIYNDVEHYTYKLAETSVPDVGTRDSLQADTGETLDRYLIIRMADYRITEIRKKIAFALKKMEYSSVYNERNENPDYVFSLVLPEKFDDNRLLTATNIFHQYVVKGTLLDWYRHCGTSVGENLVGDVARLENEVENILRTPQFVKSDIPIVRSFRIR